MSTKREGKIWIEGMDSPMINATLSGKQFREDLGERTSISILPDVWVIKIGGQSVMDRGREAVMPILEELVAAHQAGTRFILCTGGGTRARHVYSLGLDLNLPTGMLARLGSTVPIQNARMLQLLTAKHGGIVIYADDFDKLPFFLSTGCIPITSGMPPNEFWEKSASVGLIPSNRTDAGTYLLGEFLGAKGVLYIKDEDGLYTDDPKKNPDVEFIPDITAQALLDSGQDDLIVERVVPEYMLRAEKTRQIQIINGMKRGNITAALQGEHVGTIIRAA
jgi:molybdenum storage protein